MRKIFKLYFELSFRILGTWNFWNSFIISTSHLSPIWSLLIWFFLNRLISTSAQTRLNIWLQFSCFALSRRWRLCFFRINLLFVLYFLLFLLSQGSKYINSTCYAHFLISQRWLNWLLHHEFAWWLCTFILCLLSTLEIICDFVNYVDW